MGQVPGAEPSVHKSGRRPDWVAPVAGHGTGGPEPELADLPVRNWPAVVVPDLSLHAGPQPDPATGARAQPIYQSTSFVFDDTDHAAALYNLERPGHIYTRLSNPTTAALEERVAALEDGVAAVATASGMAALFLGIMTLMDQGAHIVSSGSLYGGSHNLFTYTMPRFGITTNFVDPRDPDAFRKAIRPETRLLYGETLGNPGIEVMDIPAIAKIAHEHGLPLMIDSTFTTPSNSFDSLDTTSLPSHPEVRHRFTYSR